MLARVREQNAKNLCRASGDLCSIAKDAARRAREEMGRSGQSEVDLKSLKELTGLIKELSALNKALDFKTEQCELAGQSISVVFENGCEEYGK